MFTVYWQLSKGLRNQFLFERGFDMSIEIVLEGQLEKEADREQFSAFLKQVCDDKKLKMEDYDTSIMIDICPEGYIECGYEDRFVSIAAQTNVAGPGFHAYVCTVFDAIISGSQIPLEVSDPTGYYTDRNFETLRYQYFYRLMIRSRHFRRTEPLLSPEIQINLVHALGGGPPQARLDAGLPRFTTLFD